jgi:DNA repair photolyase
VHITLSASTSQTLLTPEVPAVGRISVREVMCSTLLHRLVYYDSTGYTANLYKGCSHGCVYCYAPSLTHDERRWGSYVDVKVNALRVLERELRGLRKDEVFLSSASDPYQPVEAKYRLTRRCLEVLLRKRFPVSILTRSPLVLRDLDLLTKFECIRVGMSITSVPVRQFEPGVPPLERRIDTLKKLGEAGIPTYVSLAPVIPGLVMVDLERLFADLSDAGVSQVSFAVLRFEGYEESRRLFEETAGVRFAQLLEGRDELVAKLSELVRRFGMKPRDSMSWNPDSVRDGVRDGQQISFDSLPSYSIE